MGRRVVRVLCLGLVASGVVSSVSVTSGLARSANFPVIGCADSRYDVANRWYWEYRPNGTCESPRGQFGIRRARWSSWGRGQARATGQFVDGKGYQYPATITAYDLRKCGTCNGQEAARSYYRYLHIVSPGGTRDGTMRGPFNITLYVAPQRRIITLGDFQRHRRSVRVSFVIGYMTSHPDHVCYHGAPTHDDVAANVAGSIAEYHSGYDPATGATHSPNELVGTAIRGAEAQIGC